MTWRRLTGALGALLSVVIFVGALIILYRALREYDLADVFGRLREIAPSAVFASLLATAGSYIALSGFDWLALRHIRLKLPYRRILLASFTSHAVSHSAGFGALTGGAIRYRVYSAAGLTVLEVAGVVVFCGLTFILGALTLAASALILEPGILANPLGAAEGWISALGFGTIGLVIAYVGFGTLRQRPFRLFNRSLMVPQPRTAVAQISIAAIDICCAAGALYVLLPAGVEASYPGFVAIYVLANLTGLMAHVPGGLGVFETAVMVMVPGAPADAMFGALLAFRGLYFLLPLALGAVVLGGHEAAVRRHALRKATQSAGLWAREAMPSLMATIVFAAGTLLFYSAISIRSPQPLAVVPALVGEGANLVAGIVGVSLVVVARGLHRRLFSAYRWAVVLLIVGDLALLAVGEHAILVTVFAVVVAVLAAVPTAFYRPLSMAALGLSAPWAGAVATVLLGGLWLLMLNIKPVAHDVAWLMEIDADGARSARVALIGAAWGLASLARLLRSRDRGLWPIDDGGQIAHVVGASSAASANLASRRGVRHILDRHGNAFITFVPQGGDWIALGEPVGPRDRWVDLAWEFREQAERVGARPVFWNVPLRPLYHDLGLALMGAGDLALVELGGFDVDNRQVGRARQEMSGQRLSFDVLVPESGILSEVRSLSEEWWRSFSQEPPEEDIPGSAVGRHRVAILRRDDGIVASAVVWASGDGSELAADVVRWRPAEGGKLREWLLTELMLWGRDGGFRRFELGLVPTLDDPFNVLGRLGPVAIYACHQPPAPRGSGRARDWMEAFRPDWHPRFLGVPAELGLPRLPIIGRPH